MECEEVVGSDSEAEIDGEILGPEDLFNDEADEGEFGVEEERVEEKAEEPGNEVTKVKVEKTPKRVVKRSRVVLDHIALSKSNGLPALKKLFADFKFKGNGHEKEDLTRIMGILQHWMCYQFCPSRDFESCMLELEVAGKKKNVQTLMERYRLGIDEWGESKSVNEEVAGKKNEGTDVGQPDEFDLLLNEEIANADIEGEMSPVGEEGETRTMDGENEKGPVVGEGETMPIGGKDVSIPIDDKVETSVVSNEGETPQRTQTEAEVTLTAEQLERIERNRKLAEERRMKRLTQQRQSTETEEAACVDIEPMPVDDNTQPMPPM